LEFAELLHALPKLGAVLVPLNTLLPAPERRRQAEDAGAALVIEEPLDGDEADVALRRAVDPEEAHAVIFTSGSTGRPKLVELSYGNHEASALASARNLGVGPDDRWLCPLPLFHIGGLAVLLRSVIYRTAALVHDGFDVERVKAELESGEVTLASFVPTMLHRLCEAGLAHAPGLRAALVGGGPIRPELLEWAADHGLPVLPTYGMTETGSQIATLPAAEALARRGAVGRPLPGVEVRIAQRDSGEVLVRGPMVATGALSPDGWLHTGDIGHVDEDGYLHVDARMGGAIITGGEKVAAGEVERALLAHPAVTEAAVLGRPDPEWGEAVTAYVVLNREVPDGELAAHCRQLLAAFKVPKAIHRRERLPSDAAGKTLRWLLAEAES
jgi:o-succinylbenzoate---CoA ligase